MRIGRMRNKVYIYENTLVQNAVGELVPTLTHYLTVNGSVEFNKVQEFESKYSNGYSNMLVVKTRFSHALMASLVHRNSYKINWQGEWYSIKNFENWNHDQKYLTIYIEKDAIQP